MKVCAEEGLSEIHRETTKGLSEWDSQVSSIYTLHGGQGQTLAPPVWWLQPGKLPLPAP